jgi:uncharacterized protein YybS (DUF2232 family)
MARTSATTLKGNKRSKLTMELSPYLIWNVFITLIIAPILFSIRQNFTEIKRVDVLLNKTREEMAKVYVTKNELENNMERIMRILNKLEEKLDKLFEVKQ